MILSTIINSTMQLYHGYLWTLTFADERVAEWPLMSSPVPTALWMGLYLLMVIFGPRLMAPFQPFDLRPLLIVYNSGMTALNAYICIELFYVSWGLNYNYRCQPMNLSRDPLEMRMASVLWWFYISKLLEFVDTLFFILRKKFTQLTFLHVYHHCTMFGFWWIGVKWVASGSSFLGAMLNGGVHTIMYFYYGLAAAYPKRNFWWKKYLTVLQLVQFVIAIVQTVNGLRMDCPFPRWMGYTLIAYMTSFIILFSNFWIHAYVRKVTEKKEKRLYSEVKPVRNGFVRPENDDWRDVQKKGFVTTPRKRSHNVT